MGVFDKLEKGIERAVRSPFARVFKAEVQPVEIASEIRKTMDDRAAVLGPGRTMVPNVFTIELAESDHERLASFDHTLTDELVASAEDHADAQRYVAPGPFEVQLVAGDDLETGLFRIRPAARDGRGQPAQTPTPDRERLQQRAQHQPARGATATPAPARGEGDDHDDRAAYRRPSTIPQPEARPRTAHGPRLEVDGRRRPLTSAVTTIGRDEACTIHIDDPGASRRHAEIRISHDGPHLQVVLRDLGSTNGTFLNGEQIGTEELRSGDRITLGRTHLVFRLED